MTKNLVKNLKTIHFYRAWLTYKDIRKAYGRKTAHAAFINRLNGRPPLYGLDFRVSVPRTIPSEIDLLENGNEILKKQVEEFKSLKIHSNLNSKITFVLYLFNPNECSLNLCLESISKQRDKSFNVLIIDNCSYSTLFYKTIYDFCEKNKNCTFVGLPQKISKGEALNVAVSKSKTEYVYFLNERSILDESTTILLNDILNENNPSMFYSDGYNYDLKNNKITDFNFYDNWSPKSQLFELFLPKQVGFSVDFLKEHSFNSEYKEQCLYESILHIIKENKKVIHIEKLLIKNDVTGLLKHGLPTTIIQSETEVEIINDVFKDEDFYFVSNGVNRKCILKKNSLPRVSIIIVPETIANLKSTLETLNYNTSYDNFEIICVLSKEAINIVKKNYPSFKNVSFAEYNFGDSLNIKFSKGVEKCSGEYLVLMPYLSLPATANWIQLMMSKLLINDVELICPLTFDERQKIIDSGLIIGEDISLISQYEGISLGEYLANNRYSKTAKETSCGSRYLSMIKRETFSLAKEIDAEKSLFNYLLSFEITNQNKVCLIDPSVQFLIPSIEQEGEIITKEQLEFIKKKHPSNLYKYTYLSKTAINYFEYNKALKNFDSKYNIPENPEDVIKDGHFKINEFKNNKDLSARIKILIDGKNSKKKNVAYIYPQIENKGTFRYRVFNVCEALSNSNKYAATFFYSNELNLLSKFIGYIDILVCARYMDTYQVSELIKECKSHRVKIVFDIDDIVYDPKYIPIICEEMGLNQLHVDGWTYNAFQYTLTASRASIGITTNAFLAEKMHEYFGYPVYVIPNSFNNSQLDVDISNIKKPIDKFIIGYFSGSKTHQSDFDMIVPALQKFIEKHDNVYLEIVGELDLPKDLVHLLKNGRIIKKKRMSVTDLQKEIASVNLNIVPLIPTDFNSSKSELKFYEAALVNTPTLASPSYTYEHAIEDGVNGFLAKTCDEWYQKFEEIYARNDLEQIAKNAHKYSVFNYYNLNMKEWIETIFDNLLNNVLNGAIFDYSFVPTNNIDDNKKQSTESSFPIDCSLHF